MSRPRGSTKLPEQIYVTRSIRWPPELWTEVEARVPARERSAFIREAVKEALFRRAAERLQGYYSSDPEAVEWAEFAGEVSDE
jgi:hypothetical protein